MQRIIHQITQQLIDQLPENEQYYRLMDLRSWEFPSFIVKRIQVELERNLAESMIIPKTDWANTQSEAVVDAWEQFVSAIRAEARLPASYAKTVIETAVADVMEMLVQPRKNIPEVIFGNEDELDLETLTTRVKAVVVYPHFARLIPRYMQKKDRTRLSRKQCKSLVTKVDQKLTAKYSPLNWAQMLEPLFKMLGGEIDSELLRLFFEDKGMLRIAREFDLMNAALTRAELIETLSSPKLLNLEGYEEEQSTLFADKPDAESPDNSENTSDNDKESEATLGAGEPPEEPEELSGDSSSTEEDTESRNTGLGQQVEEDEQDAPEEEADDSLNAVFAKDAMDTIGPDDETESIDSSPNQEASDEEEDDETEVSVVVEEVDSEDASVDLQEEAEVSKRNGGGEETPMWMRYMSDEDIEEYQKQQEQEEEEFEDEPIIDLTKEDVLEERGAELREHLSGDRELFIKKIFSGSERAYEEALEEIAGYKEWRQASKYIEKNVFKRNLVDVYSGAAVDFTDQLQSYFLEIQNRNK